MSLFIHLVIRFVNPLERPYYVPSEFLIGIHTVLLPVLIVFFTPSLKNAAKRFMGVETEEPTEMEMTAEDVNAGKDGMHQGSAPTRPSSVTLPQLLPGAPEVKRIQYRSNIRKHRSALETVVSAPRLRKGRKTGKGPLDGAMLDMVGEKIVPLEESDSNDDEGNCKTM